MFKGLVIKKTIPQISNDPLTCFLTLSSFIYSVKQNSDKTEKYTGKAKYLIFANKEIFDYFKTIQYFKNEYQNYNHEKLESKVVNTYITDSMHELEFYISAIEENEIEVVLPKKISGYSTPLELEEEVYNFLGSNPSVYNGEFVSIYNESDKDFYNRVIFPYIKTIDSLSTPASEEIIGEKRWKS